MKAFVISVSALAAVVVFALMPARGATRPASPAKLRLYVMDCGTIHLADPTKFNLRTDQVAAVDLNIGCYLIVHPKGTLMWDVGAVPDSSWTPTGAPVLVRVALPDSAKRNITVRASLLSQMTSAGVAESSVTFLALSHFHYDHTANANAFAHATWLVRRSERDAMFAVPPPPLTQPAWYSALRMSKTVFLGDSAYDVFGDGSVMILSAPGHTRGHQVLYVKLADTGPVLLSGDLYHYPEQVKLQTIPTFEFDSTETRASRKAIAEFMARTGAQLWIQHDLLGSAKLKKAPEFYQ
jgi:glyoxylase-like metal-dependent hydrolase (beta-lactamase superfamily II)